MRNGGSGRPTIVGEKICRLQKSKSYWQTSGVIFIVDVMNLFLVCLSLW